MNPCKICGHPTTDILTHKPVQRCHICDFCGYIFKDSVHQLSESEEKAVYLSHQNSRENIGYVRFLKEFVDQALRPFLPIHARRGLDYGSGPTPVLQSILEEDYWMTMAIYDPFFASSTDVLDHTYDFIVSTEVIEHVNDPIRVFECLNHALERGGILAIMTLFHPSDMEEFRRWWYVRDLSHVGFFIPKTLEWIADQAGFEVLHTDCYRTMTFRKK